MILTGTWYLMVLTICRKINSHLDEEKMLDKLAVNVAAFA